jgi:hypothetical protein
VSQENPGTLLNEEFKRSENLPVRRGKFDKAGPQEKSLSSSIMKTVPQTDTGVLLEKSKANE